MEPEAPYCPLRASSCSLPLHVVVPSCHRALLDSAYPILTAADGVTRTICGLSLPSHTALAGVDEEMLSTALGHACHMVQLMAKYACVCLRCVCVCVFV